MRRRPERPALLVLAAAAAALLGVLLLSASSPARPVRVSSAATANTSPRIGPRDLVLVGSFRLPASSSDSATFAYGGTALAYDPFRHGLFLVGHAQHQLTAEVSLPRPRRGPLQRLPTARMLQPFTDATDGRSQDTGGDNTNGVLIGGQLVYGRRLIGSAYLYYDASDSQQRSHWFRPSTSLRRGRARGLFAVGRQEAGLVSGFMAAVPPAWRGPLGGPVISGNCCIPIVSRTSFGPAAFSFDPGLLGRRSPVPDHALLFYPQNHPTLGAWDSTWDPRRGRLFDGNTQITGVVFPQRSRSVLFFGTQGTGRFCYGDPTPNPRLAFKPSPDGTIYCYDPEGGGKGPHAYPYQAEVWAYDAGELAAVRSGRRAPWQLRPYAAWRMRLPHGSTSIGGAAYDPSEHLLLLSELGADGPAPVIDVYRIR